MNFHNTIPARVLFCLLLIVATGCDQTDNSTDIQPIQKGPDSEQTELKLDDVNSRYEQSLRDRLEIEEKIFRAMELYAQISQKVYVQDMELKQLLKGKPIEETINLFSKGSSGIPSDLRRAYSAWLQLRPDEKQMLFMDKWLETHMFSGILDDLDVEIKNFENRRELGDFLSEAELARFDEMRVRTQQVLAESFIDDGGLVGEDEIIKSGRGNYASLRSMMWIIAIFTTVSLVSVQHS